MGRTIEAARIASAIGDYLDRHEDGDPRCASLKAADIASGLKIAKRHLSNRSDPLLAPLTERLARLRSALDRRPDPTSATVSTETSLGSSSPPPRDPGLSLEDLARDITRRQTDAALRLRQWLSYHESPGEVLDSPAMLADLDTLIGSLRRLTEELRPLVSEVNRHRAEVPDLLSAMPLGEAVTVPT